ncbi:malonate decarboxylase holo-ACP synthase [Hansschlegelia zhihuaiae]|uniref:malonate decarboxylase holo-ACP synthase n=1 Tax=Hansschlegelia zhihuaiae TaxID=405005 RepID=UPI0013E8D1CD|nr:malonate decarboxylase holo-ACP synthase [Hansschlegelia zhihuaiae]
MRPRVHDLLRIEPGRITFGDRLPEWASRALQAAPWVVARRASLVTGRIPVGIRGASRSERFAATVSALNISETLSPEALARRRPPRRHAVFDALEALVPDLDRTGLSWGPVGAAGFELATGSPVLTGSSDLDLMLRVQDGRQLAELHGLAAAINRRRARIDVVIETPLGAVALNELLGGADQLLLRTASGARMVLRNALQAC